MFTSGFFNSINSDRKYNAEQMAAIFDGLITDGIFDSIGDHFQVTPASSGLGVNIGTGRAWLNQTWSYNDAAYPVTLGAASSSLGRKDLICLKVDKSNAVRANSLVVIAGTPAASPVEPTITDDTTNGIYYHKLAAVTIPAGATSISAANITNYIGLSTGTPYVTGLLSSTTVDELWSQWDGEFNDWWDDIKETLDDNVVTTILNKIDHITPKEATMNLYGFSHINPPPSGMEYKEYSTDAILNQISSLLNNQPPAAFSPNRLYTMPGREQTYGSSKYRCMNFHKYGDKVYGVMCTYNASESYRIAVYRIERDKYTVLETLKTSSSKSSLTQETTLSMPSYNAILSDSVMYTGNGISPYDCKYERPVSGWVITDSHIITTSWNDTYDRIKISVATRSDPDTIIKRFTASVTADVLAYSQIQPMGIYNGAIYFMNYGSGTVTVYKLDLESETFASVFSQESFYTDYTNPGKKYSLIGSYYYFILYKGTNLVLACYDIATNTLKSTVMTLTDIVPSELSAIFTDFSPTGFNIIGHRNGIYYFNLALRRKTNGDTAFMEVPAAPIFQNELGEVNWFVNKMKKYCRFFKNYTPSLNAPLRYPVESLSRYILLTDSLYDLDAEKEYPLVLPAGEYITADCYSANEYTGYDANGLSIIVTGNRYVNMNALSAPSIVSVCDGFNKITGEK